MDKLVLWSAYSDLGYANSIINTTKRAMRYCAEHPEDGLSLDALQDDLQVIQNQIWSAERELEKLAKAEGIKSLAEFANEDLSEAAEDKKN